MCIEDPEKRDVALEEESAKGFQNWLKMCFRRLSRMEQAEDIEKEIQQLIDEGEQRGLITEDEGDMIQGIFSFRDTTAREIMIPRTETVYARIDTKIPDVIEIIIQSGHSRIPIYDGSIDNIVGILHAKDLLNCWGRDDTEVSRLMRPPSFIPETKKVSAVLKELRFNKSHLAIVIDEYGGTAGILTLEDIIEEIIGDVMDEYDAEQNLIVDNGDGSISVNARLDVEELEEYLKVDFPEGKFESVGGFVISYFGRVPGVGEKMVFKDLEFVIEGADSRKIETIGIKNLGQEYSQAMNSEESTP